MNGTDERRYMVFDNTQNQSSASGYFLSYTNARMAADYARQRVVEVYDTKLVRWLSHDEIKAL